MSLPSCEAPVDNDEDGVADVQTVTCNTNNQDQQWLMNDLGNGKYQFKNVARVSCLLDYTDNWSAP